MTKQDLIHLLRREGAWRADTASREGLRCKYRLLCISGSGLIRVMSRSHPYRLRSAQSLLIPADQVVTVSGSEEMVVILQPEH